MWQDLDAVALVCRERASGVYGTPAYFTATVLFDLIPMRVLPPCFFAAATYWMIGFRPGMWHLLTFLLLLVLSNMVSENGLHSCKLCGVLGYCRLLQDVCVSLLSIVVKCRVTLSHVMLRCTVLCYALLCCAVLSCAVLCLAVPDLSAHWSFPNLNGCHCCC